MKIKEVIKSEGGYNVHFEDSDMIAFVHLPKEVEGLKKDGWIKESKKKAVLKTKKK